MSVLEFIASLVESLAWPAAALSAVLALRVPISNALEKRLRRAKFGSAEFEFDADKTDALIASVEGERVELEKEKVPSAQSPSPQSTRFEEDHDRVVRLAELAELSPVGAFLSSFIELERTLRRLLSDYADVSQVGPLGLGQEAVKQDLLSDTDYRAYEYLRHTRNKLVHAASDPLTAAQAVELASLAESLVDTALVRAVVRKQRQMEKNLGYPLGSDGETSSET